MNNDAYLKRIHARHRAERRFRRYGLLALLAAAAMLLVLLASIFTPGMKGLQHSLVTLELHDTQGELSAKAALAARFPDVSGRRDKRDLARLLAPHADSYITPEAQHSITVPLSSSADLWIKDGMPQDKHRHYGLSLKQAEWLKELEQADTIDTTMKWAFFVEGDSREPEKAGFGGSILGSLFVVLICLVVTLPLGVAAAVYLEEFAKPSRWKDLIEVNINNLAAIPSIIYGLLGLFVYLALFGLPRSSALVGGLTLSLLTLPMIIIATRVALNAVPNSLRNAARGMGASPLQVVTHHVLPQAMPGIMTGTILGMARAIGETAPLLMIGMVAFIATPPESLNDPATAMPVQIYLWASSPEQGFVQKTASGILVLITILLCMNLLANYIRGRSERKR